MRVSVPKEIKSGEKRVALVPDIISKLTKAGLEVVIESGAGVTAQASDEDFKKAGAEVKSGDVLTGADVVLSVQPLTPAQMKSLKKGKAIFHNPHTPVKCGGAPHKIMYLAADYFRKHGVLKDIQIEYWSGGTRLFAVEKYEKTLLNVCKRANIQLNFFQKILLKRLLFYILNLI